MCIRDSSNVSADRHGHTIPCSIGQSAGHREAFTGGQHAARRLVSAELEVDLAARSVSRGAAPVALTGREFDLLVHLMTHPGQAFSRELLLQEVWGYRHPGDTRLVNVHVQRLRSKIERDPERPEIVVTVRGIGYRAGTPSAP